MTQFRPCIDLHEGRVKQIVGGSLRDDGKDLATNFVSDRDAGYYAELYRRDSLRGGHIIMLGQGNEMAALSALHAYPLGMQVGGGVHSGNAAQWLAAGASHVIVTSWIFPNGKLDRERLQNLSALVGADRLVLDLSCRKIGDEWKVAINRWQTVTPHAVNADFLDGLAPYCDEFLVHAADVEGLQAGMDLDLIRDLGRWGKIPVTYAGGAQSLADLETCARESGGKVDLTIGSALDIFGGKHVRYGDCVRFNAENRFPPAGG